MVTLALLLQGGQDGALENGNCSEIGCILFHYKVVPLVCWLKLAVRVVWNPRQLAEESGGNKIISQLRETQSTKLRNWYEQHAIVSAEMEFLRRLRSHRAVGVSLKQADSAPVTQVILSGLLYKKLIWTKGKLVAHKKSNEEGIVSEVL